MRPLLPALLLTAVIAGGCLESIPGMDSLPGTSATSDIDGMPGLKRAWAYEAANAQGVAVNGATGDIYLSVGATFKPPYVDGGGIEVVTAQGRQRQSIPMVMPKACEGCTRLTFTPKGPQISPDHRYVYLSDNDLNLFRLETGTLSAELVAPAPTLGYGFISISRQSALSPDGRYAYLSGTHLTTLDLADGVIMGQQALDKVIRQIVPWQGNQYLLNLTENWDNDGPMAVWDSATGSVTRSTLSLPLRALASQDGWTVGVMEVPGQITRYQVVELDFSAQPPTERVLTTFSLQGSSDMTIALRTDKKQVIIGNASAAVRPGAPPETMEIMGSTLVVDAARGVIAKAETSSVKGIALSPDGQTVYVADTNGLKAFALP